MKMIIFLFFWMFFLFGCGNTVNIPVSVPETTPTPTPIAEKEKENTPVVTPTPMPSPVIVASSTPTPTPEITPTPSATPTPTPVISTCTLNQSGSSTRAYTNTHNGQPFTFTIQGSISCTNGMPDLFTLFSWQIQNYCNIVQAPQACELSMSEITGSFSVKSQTVNHKYVLPVLTVVIPSNYY